MRNRLRTPEEPRFARQLMARLRAITVAGILLLAARVLPAAVALGAVPARGEAAPAPDPTGPFGLRYALASSLYGRLKLEDIVPEVRKTGAEWLDLWPERHANQREQMPGRGPLDFRPLLAALRKIGYQGWTEIFMHPVPRGIPILDTLAEVTEEVNRARECLERIAQDL